MAKQYVSGYPGLLGICVVEVQSGNRVDIPARLVRAVPWLKGKPGTKIEALAMVGSAGGIQLDAPGGMLTRRVDKIVELLRTADTVEGDDVTSSTAIAARLAAASWKVSIESGGRFTIPRGIRELALLPAFDDSNRQKLRSTPMETFSKSGGRTT